MKNNFIEHKKAVLKQLLPECLKSDYKDAFDSASYCIGFLALVAWDLKLEKIKLAPTALDNAIVQASKLANLVDNTFKELEISRRNHSKAFGYYRNAKTWLKVNEWDPTIYKVGFNVLYALAHIVELNLLEVDKNLKEFTDDFICIAGDVIYNLVRTFENIYENKKI